MLNKMENIEKVYKDILKLYKRLIEDNIKEIELTHNEKQKVRDYFYTAGNIYGKKICIEILDSILKELEINLD